MIRTYLIDPRNNLALDIDYNCLGESVLMVMQQKEAYGVFRSVSRSSAGTSVVTQPSLNGSIVVTDIIVTTDKVNLATVTIQFTDGSNTVIIASAIVTDAPCNLAIPLAGKWQGWSNARLEVVTTGNVVATVSSGYFKVPAKNTLPFLEWDALR